jgi:hypothetical protein
MENPIMNRIPIEVDGKTTWLFECIDGNFRFDSSFIINIFGPPESETYGSWWFPFGKAFPTEEEAVRYLVRDSSP